MVGRHPMAALQRGFLPWGVRGCRWRWGACLQHSGAWGSGRFLPVRTPRDAWVWGPRLLEVCGILRMGGCALWVGSWVLG